MAVSTSAQTPDAPYVHFARVASHLMRGDDSALAQLVEYPLRRRNPLADIRTPEEFIRYLPILFDREIRMRMSTMTRSDIFVHHDNAGLFDGDVWLNEDGKIIAVNYQSRAERKLLAKAVASSKLAMHRSVREWNSNLFVVDCSTHTVRIDETDRGLRLVTWKRGRSQALRPDLVLSNGTQTQYGSEGGFGWTFTNGQWTYLIERIDVCADECGYILTVKKFGEPITRCRCQEVK